ncbi:GFA family protein [Sphingomonas parva]|uniref:GFA family protein n=1 Tax=Sphingomonas parva TaxID=2555898 RepID=A0A4Y8ZW93_9SPHN|nr:GFA family protein [Sphingomonas parva]TFI60174.1 GFA family protein [Sphingomonas parva]
MESSEGGCRCGKVRFRLDGPPLVTFACHCTGCQRMTGGAYSLSTLYPSGALSVLTGEPVLGGLRGATRHYFCPDCMSWLFTRPEGLDDYVNVRSTMFDDAVAHRPFAEAWTREALPGAATGAVHSFPTEPAEESIPGLLAAFADWRR